METAQISNWRVDCHWARPQSITWPCRMSPALSPSLDTTPPSEEHLPLSFTMPHEKALDVPCVEMPRLPSLALCLQIGILLRIVL